MTYVLFRNISAVTISDLTKILRKITKKYFDFFFLEPDHFPQNFCTKNLSDSQLFWSIVHSAMWIVQCARLPQSPLWKWRGPYLLSMVVPHLMGKREWVSWHSYSGALPEQRSSRTLTTFTNFKGLYSLLSSDEGFFYFRDLLYHFGLIDFSIHFW